MGRSAQQKPRKGVFGRGFLHNVRLCWVWRSECQIYGWAQYPWIFFVSLGMTLDSAETPFTWLLRSPNIPGKFRLILHTILRPGFRPSHNNMAPHQVAQFLVKSIRCFFAPPSMRNRRSQFSAISMVFPQILVDFESISIDFLSCSISFSQLQSILISFNQF